jgi:hypothetical protein
MSQTSIDRLTNYIVARATGTGASILYTHGMQATPYFIEVLPEVSTTTYSVDSFDNKTMHVTIGNGGVATIIAWFRGN